MTVGLFRRWTMDCQLLTVPEQKVSSTATEWARASCGTAGLLRAVLLRFGPTMVWSSVRYGTTAVQYHHSAVPLRRGPTTVLRTSPDQDIADIA